MSITTENDDFLKHTCTSQKQSKNPVAGEADELATVQLR